MISSRIFLVDLLAAAQVHRAVLHVLNAVEALARALGHALDGVLGHHGVDAGAGGDELIKAAD